MTAREREIAAGAFHTNGMTKACVRTLRLVEHAVEGSRQGS
jgi:hypothetical protein